MAATRFTVRLTPRGGSDRVEGVVAGVLHVRVAAPAANDAANDALVRLLARELDVAPGSVRLEAGRRARAKMVTVGIDVGIVRARWPGIETKNLGRTP